MVSTESTHFENEYRSPPPKPRRPGDFLRYFYESCRRIQGAETENNTITNTCFMCLLTFANILAAIIAFCLPEIPAISKLFLAITACISIISAASIMRWPKFTVPAIITVCAMVISIVETGLSTSGYLTYTASSLFPLFLTVLMINHGKKLVLSLIVLSVAFGCLVMASLGWIGTPIGISLNSLTLAQNSFLLLNLVHVSMITLLFSASQIIQTDLLAEQKEKLIEVNEERRHFLALASHELRTPLNAIIGSLEVLEGETQSRQKHDMLDLLKDSAKALSTQLDDLLDMSQAEKGQLKFSLSSTNILNLTKRAIELRRIEAEEKNLYLNLNHDAEANCEILIDSARTQQIINKLISNAINNTQNGGVTVDIRCSPLASGNNAFFRILVSDTGPKLSDTDKESLFQNTSLFIDSAPTSFERFGLNISRRIAQKMNGDIVLLDHSSIGSHILFTFQATIERASSKNSILSAATLGERPRVLCVDDHPANLRILSILLGEQGLDIDVAMNGEQAIKLCNSHRHYDAILMDIMMPGMSGMEASFAIKKLSNENASTPIIALTANVAPEQIVQYIEAGMFAVVSKPIETRLLVSELNRAFQATKSTRNSCSDSSAKT